MFDSSSSVLLLSFEFFFATCFLCFLGELLQSFFFFGDFPWCFLCFFRGLLCSVLDSDDEEDELLSSYHDISYSNSKNINIYLIWRYLRGFGFAFLGRGRCRCGSSCTWSYNKAAMLCLLWTCVCCCVGRLTIFGTCVSEVAAGLGVVVAGLGVTVAGLDAIAAGLAVVDAVGLSVVDVADLAVVDTGGLERAGFGVTEVLAGVESSSLLVVSAK